MYESNEKVGVGISRKWIADNLRLGDNIIIVSHDDEHFWLMLMDKGPHSVDVSFEDDGRIFGLKVMLSYDNTGMKNYNVLVATLTFSEMTSLKHLSFHIWC
jgi:hypothetical protein